MPDAIDLDRARQIMRGGEAAMCCVLQIHATCSSKSSTIKSAFWPSDVGQHRERGNMQRSGGWSAVGVKEEGSNEGWEILWSGEEGDVGG